MSKKHRPKQTAQPRWQPIEMVPTVAASIDGMLESDVEQYQTLLEARSKPHVLDDFTVNRVKEVFSKQRNDFWIFEEQLQRWQSEALADDQRAEVARLVEQMKQLRENNAQVLALADELSKGTIDTILAKPDAELGMEYVLRMMEGK